MVTVFNSFLTYLILALCSIGIIALAVFCGKKLRDAKDARDAKHSEEENK